MSQEEQDCRLDASVLRELLAHLRAHPEIQNIAVMNAAGFCRNCLAKWRHASAKRLQLPSTYEGALEYVYGMSYDEYKARFQVRATAQELEDFKRLEHRHAKHEGLDLSPVTPGPVGFHSSACCRDEVTLSPLPLTSLPSIKPTSFSLAILVASDRAHKGVYADLSGPAIQQVALAFGLTPSALRVLPDEEEELVEVMREWSTKYDCIFTTGGTGLGARDVTPQATLRVLTRTLPGVTEMLRREGAKSEPLSWLSRAQCGVIASTERSCLVCNFPGHPSAAALHARLVLPLVPQILRSSSISKKE